MISNEWKVLILAPLAASLLVACQSKSDDAASSAPSSPYQGFWVSDRTASAIANCSQGAAHRPTYVDAIFIQGDGQVIRYTDKRTHADPEARKVLRLGRVENNGAFDRTGTTSAYGYGIHDGVFANFDGNHLVLRDRWGQEQRSYTRTTENQLQNYQVDLARCGGPVYPQPRFAQIQPPSGIQPTYPNVDPRIIRPQQGSPTQPQTESPPPPRFQQEQDPGSYPPPPETYQPDRRNQPWIQEQVRPYSPNGGNPQTAPPY